MAANPYPEVGDWTLSRRRATILIVGVPAALTGTFLLVDALAHYFTGDPWPDFTHWTVAAALLVASSILMAVHTRSLRHRALARAILASREESYRSLFDGFPEPTTVWSGEGVLLMQNLVSARNMGRKREECLGKTITEMFGAEAGKDYLERIKRVFRTGVTEEGEDSVPLPSGQRYFWTTMQRVRLPDGSAAVQVISYDVTDRVEAEQRWREEHERASTYLGMAPVIFVALDMEGTVSLINATGCGILGYEENEIVGRNWFDRFVPERIREQVRADYKRLAPDPNAAGLVYENPVLTRTGEERLIAWHPVVYRDEVGQPVGTLSSGEDITERRQAEAALRAAETLRIQERGALEERQRLARELHDSVSQALYGIALGVNTALTVLDKDREAAREALQYSISLVRAGLSEMRALIFELRPESLEAEGLAAALMKMAEAATARFEMPVNLDICGEPDMSLSGKETAYRVAQEALGNAIKHACAREITVQLSCDGVCLTLTVSDDGIGFDPHEAYPGHLGLKSMRERAASAGGSLDITSATGAGTRVQLLLPLGSAQK